MTDLLSVFIDGDPVGQGSMKTFKHKHTGKPVTVHDQGERLEDWRQIVAWKVSREWDGPPIDIPLELDCGFLIRRPASHYARNDRRCKPKESAPDLPAHGKRHDLDKLLRAVFDALTGIVFEDDCQVVRTHSSKGYSRTGGVRITVRAA